MTFSNQWERKAWIHFAHAALASVKVLDVAPDVGEEQAVSLVAATIADWMLEELRKRERVTDGDT